jgi:hypothetical protein
LFQGNNGVGFKAVKVFYEKYYPQVWRFFVKPEGLDLDSPLSAREQ